MEINGLPLHPLAVHGAVVLAPLAALLALAFVVPAWRERVRWPMIGAAVVAALSVVVAYLSGDSFREANEFFTTPDSALTDQIDDHADLGTILLWWTLGFAALAVLAGLWRSAAGWQRAVVLALLAVDAVAVVVLVVLTGDAGAQAVWSGFNG